MPIASDEVADELEEICIKDKCDNLNEWLNELYYFRQEYMVYKEQKQL